ncbi:MAG: YCF48-related protein, partial [Colwellia sp.]
ESGAEFVDPLLDVTFWTEQDGLVVGAFGQLYRTKDGGHSWMDLRSELPNEDELHLNAVMRNADQSIWIASEYGSLFYSADDGQTWQLTTLPSDGTFFSLAYKAGSREIIAAGITGNCFSVSRDSLVAKQIPLRSTQSLYSAEVLDGKLHLVGAKGSWQAGQELNIDDNRINRHAITQTQSGAFIIATAQGVQAFSATAQVIKLYYKTEENK